jgi:hypothetical protein
LEDGDAMSSSILTSYLLRFKFLVLSEICRTEGLLSSAMQRCCIPISEVQFGSSQTLSPEDAVRLSNDLAEGWDLIGLLHDASKTIKNSLIPFDPKEEMFSLLMEQGLLSFTSKMMAAGLLVLRSSSLETGNFRSTCQGVQHCCDIVAHCTTFNQYARSALLEEVSLWRRQSSMAESPVLHQPLLTSVLDVLCVCSDRSCSQAAYDAVYSCAIGLLQGNNAPPPLQSMTAPTRRRILKYWVEGMGGCAPPLAQVVRCASEVLRGNPCSSACLRVLAPIAKSPIIFQSASFIDTLQQYNLLHELAVVVTSSSVPPSVRASALALCGALVASNDSKLLSAIVRSSLFDSVMRLYLKIFRRNNLLSAAVANVVHVTHQSVHLQKLTASTPSSSPASRILGVHHVGWTLLHDDASDENTEMFSAQSVDTQLVQYAVEKYGEQIQAINPKLLSDFQHALRETPEEAQQEEHSRHPSSECIASLTHQDFEQLLAEYGPDATEVRGDGTPISDLLGESDISGGGGSGGYLLRRERSLKTLSHEDAADDMHNEDANEPPAKKARTE